MGFNWFQVYCDHKSYTSGGNNLHKVGCLFHPLLELLFFYIKIIQNHKMSWDVKHRWVSVMVQIRLFYFVSANRSNREIRNIWLFKDPSFSKVPMPKSMTYVFKTSKYCGHFAKKCNQFIKHIEMRKKRRGELGNWGSKHH